MSKLWKHPFVVEVIKMSLDLDFKKWLLFFTSLSDIIHLTLFYDIVYFLIFIFILNSCFLDFSLSIIFLRLSIFRIWNFELGLQNEMSTSTPHFFGRHEVMSNKNIARPFLHVFYKMIQWNSCNDRTYKMIRCLHTIQDYVET